MAKRYRLYFVLILISAFIFKPSNSATWQFIQRDFDSTYHIDLKSLRNSGDLWFFTGLLTTRHPLYEASNILVKKKVNCVTDELKIINYSLLLSKFFQNEGYLARIHRPKLPAYIFSSDTISNVCKLITN